MSTPTIDSTHDHFGYHVCLTRVLLLISYGYTFRRPLKRRTIGILAVLSLILILGHLGRRELDSNLGRQVVVSPDLANWLLSVFIAGNLILYLQQWSSYLRISCVAVCLVIGSLRIASNQHRSEVKPQISGFLLPYFWTLLTCSILPIYRSWDESGDWRPYLIDILVFVQAGRQAVRERHNNLGQTGIETTDTDSIAPSSQSSDDFGIVPDLGRREAFSEWSTGIVYRPLSEDKIRMLRLDQRHSPDELRFTLTHHSFSEIEGHYLAVSYFWGKSQEKKFIYINGQKAWVTARLYQTLLEVCQFYDRPFWVDALCINQSDLAERSSQVLRMKSIYGRADEVIAHFGIEDDDNHCSQMMTFLGSISLEKPHELHFPAHGKASFEDLKALVKRPYFKRVWIIQELVWKIQNRPRYL